LRFSRHRYLTLPAGLHGFKRKTRVVVRAHLVMLRRVSCLARRAELSAACKLSEALPKLSEEPAVTRLAYEIQVYTMSIATMRLTIK
jgi:hypothetical protein